MAAGDERICRIFVGLLDLQMLVGLLLYFVLSPITKAALSDFGGAMSEPSMRFWAVEHVFGMVVGIALAHVGHVAGQARGDRCAQAPAHRDLLRPGAHRRFSRRFPGRAGSNARPLIRW